MKTALTVIAVVLLIGGGSAYAQYQTPLPPPPAPPASPSPRAQSPANVKAEVTTAATHAGFAAGGGNLAYVRLHLGHALNCLEGPKGKNFNKAWGNVCEGQGNGILIDLRAVPAGAPLIAIARKADELAVSGTRTPSLSRAKSSAQQVASLLNQIASRLK